MGYKKKEETLRPGLYIPFNLLLSLETVQLDACGALLLSLLKYGQDMEIPDFESFNIDSKDKVRIDLIFRQQKPKIDEDAKQWLDYLIWQGYKGYLSVCKKDGETPMEYTEYREWKLETKAKDPDGKLNTN